MGLVCTHASLATVEELFRYKHDGFDLPSFPGYTPDQWGIKAHNRPWVAEHGEWEAGQRVIELGGAYSRLPEWLGDQHGVDPWIGDDFGLSSPRSAGSELWSRWGDPRDLPGKHPSVTYRFENFGPESTYESQSFDRVFTVSTLEHIPTDQRLGVLRDMHRTVAPGGMELHTIDIPIGTPTHMLMATAAERTPLARWMESYYHGGISAWWRLFKMSGVRMAVRRPSSMQLLDRRVLVESPDVFYRFVPPNNAPKTYVPCASLTLIVRDDSLPQLAD